ncbi:MAG: flagellar biosynthesis protein FliQ [Cyanobacteria bacterium]|nr:flagellar biosynthesis protein FliQ [Cyanobacteriota bacterium]MDA1021591.1 flagellar biosynthesis protein FliQ [Cyanobacteriota bacterium]
MDQAQFIDISNQALLTAAIVSIPILVPSLIGGVLISLFQALTQISEQTLTFVPKLVIMIISYFFAGPWIIRYMVNYTSSIIERIPEMSLPG